MSICGTKRTTKIHKDASGDVCKEGIVPFTAIRFHLVVPLSDKCSQADANAATLEHEVEKPLTSSCS